MERSIHGKLIVVSGPSGVGKGTICRRLVERGEEIRMSVSATTRSPRPGEVDGRDYFFVSRERFEEMIGRGELLEYMDVFGSKYYGTPKRFVDDTLESGLDVILEIDVYGAMKVKRTRPDALMIFISPPSLVSLKERLIGRGTETLEQISERFSKARREMSFIPEYDYIIVNDDLEKAVDDMQSILRADRLRTSRLTRLDEILKEDRL